MDDKMLKALHGLLRDLLGTAGTAMLGYGAWLWWPPAGWMAAGGVLIALAAIGAIRGR